MRIIIYILVLYNIYYLYLCDKYVTYSINAA